MGNFFENFGNNGLTNLGNKLVEASRNITHTHTHINNFSAFGNAILLSSALFGSIYMSSISVSGLNKMFLKYQMHYPLIIMNSLVILSSGFIIFLSYKCILS